MYNKYNQNKRMFVDVKNDDAEYVVNEVIGGLLEFTVPVGTANDVYGLTIRDIILREIGILGVAMTLYLFGEKPNVILDHALISTLLTADYDQMSVGNGTSLPASFYKSFTSADGGNLRRLALPNANIDITLDPNTPSQMWAYLSPDTTVTFGAANVLKLTLDPWVD